MRWLKVALVIGAILIFTGFAFIGYEVFRRATDPTYAAMRSGRVPPAARAPDMELALPPGARIKDMLAVGNRLAFTVELPSGESRLYVVDPRNGELTGVVAPQSPISARIPFEPPLSSTTEAP